MRIGILGYGSLGQYLVEFIKCDGDKYNLYLDFVWNRSSEKLKNFDDELILKDILDISTRKVDLIVEVAHPSIMQKYGVIMLSVANLLVGSPTAFSDATFENNLKEACKKYNRSVFIPSGAFWGAQDIQKMASLNTLGKLHITMKKHPTAFRLVGYLKEKNDEVLKSLSESSVILYNGPVRQLCSLAPNNVNTMAAAAIAAHNLGFDVVTGCLIADPMLSHWHIVEIEVKGKSMQNGLAFESKTVRKNPSNPGAVTGSATYGSFRNSLLQILHMHGPGFHLC